MSADFRILLTLSVSVVTGERNFFQLKLINSHNHIAGEIGESSHVSIESGTSPPEGHCQSLCQKTPGRQSFKVHAGFFCLHECCNWCYLCE